MKIQAEYSSEASDPSTRYIYYFPGDGDGFFLLKSTFTSDHIVTHMTTARQRGGKHVPKVTLSKVEGHPLLGNESLNTFPLPRISSQ
jgi:hypothetical protein